MQSNVDSLKKLCEKVTGKTSEATTTAEVIDDITKNYVAGSGDGSKVITPNLTCTSEVEVKEEEENAN